MISKANLTRLSKVRLRDAEALFDCKRWAGSIYMCGYAVELALKQKICLTLGWPGFPPDSHRPYTNLKVHDLNVLLDFTGVAGKIKSRYMTEWTRVNVWNPENRYEPVGTVTKTNAADMISSAKIIMKAL